MLKLLRRLLFQGVMYMAEPSIAGGAAPAAAPAPAPAGGGEGAPKISAADARAYLADFTEVPADMPDDKVFALHTKVTQGVVKHAPKGEEPKADDVKVATEFLTKNVDGFDPKDIKPGQIMAYRSAYDVWAAGEARKFLKSQGVKAEDVAKMSPADAIKAADEARNKPVAYPDFKLPDGMQKHEALDKDFKAWAGKNKISPEAAQELVTAYSTHLKSMLETSWDATQKTWKDQVNADPKIGGDKLVKEVLPAIGKMLEEVTGGDSKGLREALNITGFGNHPEGVRFLHAISAFFTEGAPNLGGGPSGDGQKKPAAQQLYPNQPSEQAAA